MCTGRLDLSYILRAFSNGADGVFIIVCHLNECNYITHGNFHALSMAYLCKKLMEHIGLNPERFRIQFMSGGEGNLFAEVMNDFSKQVRELGPLGISDRIDKNVLKAKLDAVTSLVPYMRLVERERLRLPFKTKAEFETFFASDEFNRLFKELILDKLAISQITSLLKGKPLSTGKIAEALGLTPSEVSRHMNTSSRHGLVKYDVDQKSYALA
jgi:coenzyme F420-reducing hydrogenase delta subunit/biotin operon repressor